MSDVRLLEDGTRLLLEDSFFRLLEIQGATPSDSPSLSPSSSASPSTSPSLSPSSSNSPSQSPSSSNSPSSSPSSSASYIYSTIKPSLRIENSRINLRVEGIKPNLKIK